MFEVNRDYKFLTIEGVDQVSWMGEVREVSLPLIKVIQFNNSETIINTSSPGFVSEEIQPYRSPKEKAASRRGWSILLDEPDENA